jgi:lactate racemase
MSDTVGAGKPEGLLSEEEVERIYAAAVASWEVRGKRVLLIVPDGTRSCPMGQAFRLLYEHVAPQCAELNVLIALGTHAPMSAAQIDERLGIGAGERESRYPKARFFNHEFKNPRALTELGVLQKAEVAEITNGLFELDVPISCNQLVRENDLIVIVGPVFPHEVVGFSGGNKYLFPGVAGQEIIDFFHWLGAIITNAEIIGTKLTPVRKVVDRAARLVPAERRALCMVVRGDGLAGLYGGTPEAAWSAAADLSAQVHVTHVGRSFKTVLSCAPKMYDDLWTGGKCMYKLEPVVADGGTLVIYAPHITEVSSVHGAVLEEIGYHTRDFFLKQWERYKAYPWGVLAHSTHVKGAGTFENGVEKPRVQVVLATGIPEAVCRKINLGYQDPATIRREDFEGREDDGILYVAKAGEILYRV